MESNKWVQRWVGKSVWCKKYYDFGGNIFLLLISWVYTLFRQIFGLTSGTSVRSTVGLISVRKSLNCFNFYIIDFLSFHKKIFGHNSNLLLIPFCLYIQRRAHGTVHCRSECFYACIWEVHRAHAWSYAHVCAAPCGTDDQKQGRRVQEAKQLQAVLKKNHSPSIQRYTS